MNFEQLRAALREERRALVEHPLYARLDGLDQVRVFMATHVYAVWDFMSLLKTLQRELTCVEAPWRPRGDSTARRLINEIVVGEESDDAPGGGYASHFELYLAAMRACGAPTDGVERFVELLDAGGSVSAALERAPAPRGAALFVESTFATIRTGSLARVAAAFTIGREEIIPDMFVRVVRDLSREHGDSLALFVDYLERHIQLDGERHGPMAARMLEAICASDERAWCEALDAARKSLVARRELWDSIVVALSARTPLVAR